jgi:iron complex transport system substrate-binding protein
VADPQWQALQAVQDGAIYGFPADIFSWDQPDPRWILGVTWLAGKIHPNRFPGLDMERETVQFFGQLYGIDEAVVETQILPRLNLEGHVE